MMAYGNIELQAYKEQAINTMTAGEMLILLYDELVKRLKKAKILAGKSDFENFEAEIKRCQEIVSYLNINLDRKFEISKNLSSLYNFFNYQLIRVNASRNMELIDELLPLVEDLRETYREADKLSKVQTGIGGTGG